jgi:uncharacterized protein (DUF433 family)
VGERRILGRFIVMDPAVGGGEPTFRGTHLTVREVVEGIAREQYWDALIEQSEGTLSRRAIAEALALCTDAFLAETERLRGLEDQTPLALGDFIVMHPGICHGQPTYTGSRVMVWQVLQGIEHQETWDMMEEDWPGTVTKPAIAESVRLALSFFLAGAQVADPRDQHEGV